MAYKFLSSNIHHHWSQNDQIMMDLYFHAIINPRCKNAFPEQQQSLRIFPAETELTVYRLCIISDRDVTFRFLCCILEWQIYFGYNYFSLFFFNVREYISVKYELLGQSQCRERFEKSFEMMQNISHKNNEQMTGGNFSPHGSTMVLGHLGVFFRLPGDF